MSDIAPFVEAFSKQSDGPNRKLLQERRKKNERLRHVARRLRNVSITGSNGTPVHATGQLDEGFRHVQKQEKVNVSITAEESSTSVDVLAKSPIELHVGELVKVSFNPFQTNNVCSLQFCNYDNDAQSVTMTIIGNEGTRLCGVQVVALVSPISALEYQQLLVESTSLIELTLDPTRQGQEIEIVFQSVIFSTGFQTGWSIDVDSLRQSSSTLLLLLGGEKQQQSTVEQHSGAYMVAQKQLAEQVATKLVEKTILDLAHENERLEELLARMRTVAVTGPGGHPVYATGQVDKDGGPNENSDVHEYFVVHLTTKQSEMKLDSIQTLVDAEIHIGEFIVLSLTKHIVGRTSGFNHGGAEVVWLSGDNMRIEFGSYISLPGLTLTVDIHPVTEQQYASIINNEEFVVDQETFSVNDIEQVLGSLVGDGGATVDFSNVDFHVDPKFGWNMQGLFHAYIAYCKPLVQVEKPIVSRDGKKIKFAPEYAFHQAGKQGNADGSLR